MLELLEEQVNEILDEAFPNGMPPSVVEAAIRAGRCELLDYGDGLSTE